MVEPNDVMSTASYQLLAISGAVYRRAVYWVLCYYINYPSPMLYINYLPNFLGAAAPRMFADDTNITPSAKTLTPGTQRDDLSKMKTSLDP